MGAKEKEGHLGRLSKVILDCLSENLRNFGIHRRSIGASDDVVPVLGISYLLGLFIPFFVEGREPHKHVSKDVGTRL
jgi:hypothetical protein